VQTLVYSLRHQKQYNSFVYIFTVRGYNQVRIAVKQSRGQWGNTVTDCVVLFYTGSKLLRVTANVILFVQYQLVVCSCLTTAPPVG